MEMRAFAAVLALSGAALAFGLGRRPATEGQAATLAYRAPESCVWTYRVRVDERFDIPNYANFYNRAEEHSTSWLGLGRDPTGRLSVHFESDDAGVRAQNQELPRPRAVQRAMSYDPTQLGPGAPDAACRDRSWDPLEDAIALAFPRLPKRPVAAGARWRGAEVRGDGTTCSARDHCCNLGACLDAEGNRDRNRACVVPPWQETLPALDLQAGVAQISSRWSDGRPGDGGARSEREVEFDLRRGRVRSAQIEHRHPLLGLTRTMTVEAIDACEGLDPAAEDSPGLARIGAAFEYKPEGGNSPGT